jgi:signal peptidase I
MKKHYKMITLVVSVLTVVTWAFAHPYNIPGDCMEPAIKDGSHVFVNHISPYLRQYQIGDIIAFKHEGKEWVSRIVALEAETVQITEGKVIVNGVAQQSNKIFRNWSNWKYGTYAIDRSFQVPLAHVFVLSDNLSAQHDDSRVFGPISENSIVGLVW